MNIKVTQEVLDNPLWYPLLDVVVAILQQRDIRHAFDVSQYDTIAASPWLSGALGARASTAEFIRSSSKAANRDISSDAVTLMIDDLAPPCGETVDKRVIRVYPLAALAILMQPLYVIVEDENSDGAFVLWMARLLGLDAIQRSYRAGRLMFRHAGGKNQFAKSAKALSFGVWPRDDEPILSLQLRAIALLDSDAHFPGDSPNAQIVQDVKAHVAFVHMLNGRFIESYVPEHFFHLRLDKDRKGPKVHAYFRLTESQRNHFPIKDGFMDNATPPQPQDYVTFLADRRRKQEERDLYRTVDPRDWVQLAAGMGSGVASVYQDKGYRCQHNTRELLTRNQQTELNALLTRVIRYL